MKKEDKLNQLIIAVEQYNSLPQHSPQQPPPNSNLEKVPAIDWEEINAIEDADMEG